MEEISFISEDLKGVLLNMLQVNPYFRFSARELLKNKCFDSVRRPENEVHSGLKFMFDID